MGAGRWSYRCVVLGWQRVCLIGAAHNGAPAGCSWVLAPFVRSGCCAAMCRKEKKRCQAPVGCPSAVPSLLGWQRWGLAGGDAGRGCWPALLAGEPFPWMATFPSWDGHSPACAGISLAGSYPNLRAWTDRIKGRPAVQRGLNVPGANMIMNHTGGQGLGRRGGSTCRAAGQPARGPGMWQVVWSDVDCLMRPRDAS